MRRDLLSRRWESNPLTDGSRPPVLKTLVTSRYIFADVTGVEPAPNCVTGRHLNRLTSHPYFSLSDRVRTCGLRVPNSPLYQTELHLVIFFFGLCENRTRVSSRIATTLIDLVFLLPGRASNPQTPHSKCGDFANSSTRHFILFI